MVSTLASYRMITRDMTASLSRVEKQPMVARETEYYQANIGKITSIEEFVDDTRLFNYAMKAHGLSDMSYAKAFMVKALEEGIGSPDSFANKLTDKRYAEFVRTYNFSAHGAGTMDYSPAGQGTAQRYQLEAALQGVSPTDPVLAAQVEYFKTNIVEAKSIDDFLADDALYSFALKAYGLGERLNDKPFMRQILQGGVSDPDSLANRQSNPAYAEFAAVFDFAGRGEQATGFRPAVEGAADKYTRQTLEENAGAQNEGVRLALYFQRKAATLTTPFQILADDALASVVRTALGMPDAMARADVDRQADLIRERIDFAEFKDPEKLDKFLSRFTAMWEMNNGSAAASSPIPQLFGQSIEFGISTDVMMTLQRLRG